MLTLSRSIPDRKFFLQFLAITFALTAALVAGLNGAYYAGCLDVAPGSFSVEKKTASPIYRLAGESSPLSVPAKPTPAGKNGLPAPGTVPFAITQSVVRLISPDGSQVIELRAMNDAVLITHLDLGRGLVVQKPLIIADPSPQKNPGESPDDDSPTFDLHKEPNEALRDPRKSPAVSYEP